MKLSPYLAAIALLACASSAAVRKNEVSPGTWELECSTAIGRCTDEADRLCRGRGYDVIGGFDRSKRYGHEAGESQVEVRLSRLTVLCNDRDGKSRLPPESATSAQGAPPPPASVAPAPASTSSRPLLCTPGSTQRCFGTGACEGGQSCLPDGSGFGACDCGPKPAAAPPASAAPGAAGF